MAPDAPPARDDDPTDAPEDAPKDDAPKGITGPTKVFWALGAAAGAYFLVSGLVGILG